MKFIFRKQIFGAVKFFHCAFLILLLFIFFFSDKSNSQSFPNKRSSDAVSNSSVFFSRKYNYGFDFLSDTLKKSKTEKTDFRMKKNPWKAVAYSAILPGAGQFYTGYYWKIPIIAGLGGYFVYGWINNNNKYLDYKELYQNSQTPENPSGNQQLLTLREFYSDQRDNFIIYSVILYVANLIDAYVDAQLYDFNVSDKIRVAVSGRESVLNINFNF